MSASSPREKRVQFVAFWAGVAVTLLFVSAVVWRGVSIGAAEAFTGGAWAALCAGVAAFSDRAWLTIEKAFDGGEHQ